MTTQIVATRLNSDDRLAMVETAALLLLALWILPLAYLVRNLPVAGRAVLAGARQLDPALEETAFGDFVTSIMLYTYDTRPISLEVLASLRQADVGTPAAYGVVRWR